jgi:glycosyltransferase involved in cell wall biosynthesis
MKLTLGIQTSNDNDRLQKTLNTSRLPTAEHASMLIVPDIARGGAACLNWLMRNTSATIILMLEGGCIVGPSCIEHLLGALESSPRAGLAGPSTNRAWNEQRVFDGASENDVEATAAEAERRFGSECRTLAPLYSLSDFCYAVKREVYEAIGPADEGYGLGPCWEMDYNIRAARAGFDGLWVCGAYVWRPEPSPERRREEALNFEASKRRYQDKFCGARLRGEKRDYRLHCRGDACPNFAPRVVAPPPAIAVSDTPLVSCIMPTCDRRPFVRDALRCFFAQDYPNLELIVVDDGADAIADLIPADSRVRYFRLPKRLTVGAKRNFACEQARGEVIAHWDDDDWYPPSRLRTQMAAMHERGGDVCGSSILYFHRRDGDEAFLYRYSGGSAPWVAGTTLVYRREVWQRNPFPDLQVGEDTRFVWQSGSVHVVDLKDPTLCVAAIHAGNVSPKNTLGVFWSRVPIEGVRALMAAGAPPDVPLVSCVMATYNRRAFVPLALAAYRAQTYPHRELIVIDDGDDRVDDLLGDAPDVRYLHVDHRLSLGAKRNLGCNEARGEIIALWDDDDWYASTRIERQAAPILRGDADITGLLNRFLLQLPQRKCWTVTGKLHSMMYAGDVPGGTMVFRRSIWEGGIRFPDYSLAEDAAFLREALRRGQRLLRVDDDGALFVYVRHGANTWSFETGSFLRPSGWREAERPDGFPVESLNAYAAAASAHALTADRA